MPSCWSSGGPRFQIISAVHKCFAAAVVRVLIFSDVARILGSGLRGLGLRGLGLKVEGIVVLWGLGLKVVRVRATKFHADSPAAAAVVRVFQCSFCSSRASCCSGGPRSA